MATVYLHIGLPKTGTTSLRRFFWEKENRAAFEKHGICFPDFGFRYHRIDTQIVDMRRNGHFLIAPYYDEEGNANFKIPSQDYDAALDKIAELGKRFDKILLTDEGIWKGSTNRQEFWPQLKIDLDKRNLDLKIIVYFRRQDLWMESYYAQNIKDGDTSETLHDFLSTMKKRKYPVDYYAYMNKLADVFGKDALIIRIFERGQFVGEEKSIYSDFLDIFGLSISDGFVLKHGVYNTKFEGNYLEMRRTLNRIPEYRIRKRMLLKQIEQVQDMNVWDYDYRQFTYFNSQDRKAYLASLEESNAKLAREYLGREDGRLFYEEAKELPEFNVDEKELLRDVILVYGKAIEHLSKVTIDQAEKIKALENEHRVLDKQMKKFSASAGEIAELKNMMKSLREDVLLYRLKRKTKNLFGKK